jgi:hypothetical protein
MQVYSTGSHDQLDQRLFTTNDRPADIHITKFSELMEALEAVKDIEGIERRTRRKQSLQKRPIKICRLRNTLHPAHWITKR